MTGHITTSWEVFDKCNRCGAKAGKTCTDMRGKGALWLEIETPSIDWPHKGRKKLPKTK